MTSGNVIHPEVKWAERKEFIFLTVSVPNAKDLKVDLKEASLDFKCTSEGTPFEFSIAFPHEIIVDESKYSINRNVQFKLVKKESQRWRQVTKEKSKCHWLKCDWDKWMDTDDEESGGKDGNFNDFDSNSMDFGGMGGMPGLGGMMGGMGGLGGMMGGMGGLGGMGGMPGGMDFSSLLSGAGDHNEHPMMDSDDEEGEDLDDIDQAISGHPSEHHHHQHHEGCNH